MSEEPDLVSEISFLDHHSPVFPDTSRALTEAPNGLLAIGGNLAPQTIVTAYRTGIFPWYSEGEPIMWWSPAPRMVLSPQNAHFSKSLRKFARKKPFRITADSAFDTVIQHCAAVPREGQDGTWISQDMAAAYNTLNGLNFAHSVEAWNGDRLVGGLYGIAIGRIFFGESMFSLESGASKIAFASLCKQLLHWNFALIDCQIHTPLLASFGATLVSREEFEQGLAQNVDRGDNFDWQSNWSIGECGFDGS